MNHLEQAKYDAQAKLENAQKQLECLNNPFVQAVIAQHPDCAVRVNYHAGQWTIYLGFMLLNRERQPYDIRDVANSADDDGWVFCEYKTLYRDDDLTIHQSIYVCQDFDPDEKATLRNLGKLTTQIPTVREVLTCDV